MLLIEAEHGYACPLPIPDGHNHDHLNNANDKLSSSPSSLRKSQGSRLAVSLIWPNYRNVYVMSCEGTGRPKCRLGRVTAGHGTLNLPQ